MIGPDDALPATVPFSPVRVVVGVVLVAAAAALLVSARRAKRGGRPSQPLMLVGIGFLLYGAPNLIWRDNNIAVAVASIIGIACMGVGMVRSWKPRKD
ncbi:MAG: hypothetical protein H0W15_11095 [Gemmatimonadales bacterium]|nr:hypothetical protein [Gemmatimonadales bacterium]